MLSHPQKTPLIFAHRGARRQAPENTLPAFLRAQELGADGVELDVQITADGQVVVFHDSKLDRTTDGTGSLKDKTLAELLAFDAGSSFDEAFQGTLIPTLDQVFDSLADDILINIELKDFSLKTTLVDRVAERIRDHSISDRILFSSFNPFMLRRAKKLLPEIPVGYLYSEDLPLPLAKGWLAVPIIGPHEARHPHFTMVDQAYMIWARERGYRVNVWTVNDESDILRMAALGVDSIITDLPDLALSLLSPAE